VPLTGAAVAAALASGQLYVQVLLSAGAIATAIGDATLTVHVNVGVSGNAIAGASGSAVLSGAIATPRGPRITLIRFQTRTTAVRFAQRRASIRWH
jgi:hypothetical protein